MYLKSLTSLNHRDPANANSLGASSVALALGSAWRRDHAAHAIDGVVRASYRDSVPALQPQITARRHHVFVAAEQRQDRRAADTSHVEFRQRLAISDTAGEI
jgi:hypothetical protein